MGCVDSNYCIVVYQFRFDLDGGFGTFAEPVFFTACDNFARVIKDRRTTLIEDFAEFFSDRL